MEAMKLEVIAAGESTERDPLHYRIVNEHGHVLADTLNCHHTIEPEEQRKFLEKLVSCYGTCASVLPHPPDAERFDSMPKYLTFVDVPSVLAPGVMQRKLKLLCPRCGEGHAPKHITDRIDCVCGVTFACDGMSIHVWATPRRPQLKATG